MMEPRKYNLRPLPGGRRGAPGADAGCYSSGNVGDAGLNRRVPVDKYTTADEPLPRGRWGASSAGAGCSSNAKTGGESLNRRALVRKYITAVDGSDNDVDSTPSLYSEVTISDQSFRPTSPTPSTVSSVTSRGAALETISVSSPVPTTSTSRTRMKWSSDMNEFVIRTYLYLTSMETDTKSYLEPLHVKFLERFPSMTVSRQRLGDQRRAIMRRKLLPQQTIDTIYREVREDLEKIHEHSLQNRTLHTQTQSPLIQSTQQNTQTGQRMRWTREYNEHIISTYYKITKLERDKTAYRKLLHEQFVTKFPHLAHVSEQRVSDQRRVIINNHLISPDRIEEIKHQAALELQITEHEPPFNSTVTLDVEQHTLEPANTVTQISENSTLNNIQTNCNIQIEPDNINAYPAEQNNHEIDDVFNKAYEHFKETDPVNRQFIPKQKSSKKLFKIVNYINTQIIPNKINENTDFLVLQTVLYCSAWTAARMNGSKLNLSKFINFTGNRAERPKPHWQKRLENKILDLRSKIGKLTQYIRGTRSDYLNQQIESILQQYKIHSIHEEPNSKLSHFLDTLKQKLAISSNRLSRYKKCTLRKTQNNDFNSNEKKFYRNLSSLASNQTTQVDNLTPDPKQLRDYWAEIWSNPVQHNAEASWIHTEQEKNNNIPPMQYEVIPTETFHKVIKNLHNWKTPGSDHIHNYWYKKFTYIHPYIYKLINSFIKNPEKLPSYVTTGTTYMLPKDRDDMVNPAKYRPITCLQTIYKIITACLSDLIYNHLDQYKLLTEQQKGCRKFSQGCKEQITIDSVILKQVLKTKVDLYTTYIDYKKAFDSVPHSWLFSVLHLYKIHPQLISFLRTTAAQWSTRLQLNSSKGLVVTDPIEIKRGIFQGDALSPLWFCLALNPLSNLLNSIDCGYTLKYRGTNEQTDQHYKLNHLLYMDDIKLYAQNSEDIDSLLDTTQQFSKDIKMEFGIDKCKTNSIKAGKIHHHPYQLETGQTIQPLNEYETYKYLGFQQARQILVKETKIKLTEVFQHRLNSILNTQLNSKNSFKAINTYAIPVLTYSFGVVGWTKSNLKNLQRKINVSLTKHRKHHPRACVQRQTLPRKEGGRGLIDIHNLHNKQITSLRQYFHSKQKDSKLHEAIVLNDNKLTPLNLHDTSTQPNEILTDYSTKIAEWTRKSLHGRHRLDLSQPNVDKYASNEWLVRGELFPETEGFMIAIQDQTIETRNYQRYIIKAPNLPTDICRRCNSSSETIQHITGACKSIVQTDYKYRHDQVAQIIHQKLATKYHLVSSSVPYYKYIPDIILENSTHKLYYDRAILTDRTIHYNRPDIILINKIQKSAYIIDIAIPNTHNLQSTIAEKISKYTELKEEVIRMWRLQKVTIVPIVLSTTGVIPVQLHHSLESLNLPKFTYNALQKSVILNTCRIVRKFLQCEQEITTVNRIPDNHQPNVAADLA